MPVAMFPTEPRSEGNAFAMPFPTEYTRVPDACISGGTIFSIIGGNFSAITGDAASTN